MAALDDEIKRALDEPIRSDEIEKAIKQARALFAYSSESITNQAFWIGYTEMFSDYTWFETFLDRVSAITPENVLAVARKYLVPTNRVVGIYRPAVNGRHG